MAISIIGYTSSIGKNYPRPYVRIAPGAMISGNRVIFQIEFLEEETKTLIERSSVIEISSQGYNSQNLYPKLYQYLKDLYYAPEIIDI